MKKKKDNYSKKFKKMNSVLYGGALTMNTSQLLKPNPEPGKVLAGSLGIGVTGIVSTKMFDALDKKFKKK